MCLTALDKLAHGRSANNPKIIDRERFYFMNQQTTVNCRCCNNPITLVIQPRRVKSDLTLLTCRTPDCKLENVTMAFEQIADYQTRDLAVWGLACR